MKQVLKKIVDEYGRDIYLEERRLEGLIADIKPDASKLFRNQIVGIMHSKCLNEIIRAREIDDQRVRIIFRDVIENTGYSEKDVDYLLQCIFYSLGLSYNSPLINRGQGNNSAPGIEAFSPKPSRAGTGSGKGPACVKSKPSKSTAVFQCYWFYLFFVVPSLSSYFAAAFYWGILDNAMKILMCLASASIFILSDVIVKDKTNYTGMNISYILINRMERQLLLLAIAGISIIYIRCL